MNELNIDNTKEDIIKYVLKYSKLSSERRGSKTIREIDVKMAINQFKNNVSSNKFFYIPVAGNGGCLFTSIRLSMELSYVLNKIDEGNPIEKFVLDGHSENMLQASNNIRSKIVEWFRRFLSRDIPQLGNYTEGINGRKYQRGDLLALEMVRNGKDVPETGPERETVILKYLLHMSLPNTWGSTPEYTAAACMTGKRINIWQDGENGLFIINSINGDISHKSSEESKITVCVFNGAVESKLQANNETELQANNETELQTSKLQSQSQQSQQQTDNAENDAVLYEDGDNIEDNDELSDIESDDDDDQNDSSYNLYFKNNHYMPIVTRTQYLKLISVYGIDKLNNFQELK